MHFRVVSCYVCLLAFSATITNLPFVNGKIGSSQVRSLAPVPLKGPGIKFAPAQQLQAFFAQDDPSSTGHHSAMVQLNTNALSLNADHLDAVKSVNCGTDGTISLLVKDPALVQAAQSWPNQEMVLMVSNRWKCGDNNQNPFRLVSERTVDTSKNLISFKSKPCDITKMSGKFTINVKWNDPPKGKRSFSKLRRNTRAKRETATTDQGSNPLPLGATVSQGTSLTDGLSCDNCFTQGSVKLDLLVEGDNVLQKISNSKLSLDGNLLANVDLKVSATAGASVGATIEPVGIPLSPLSVPGVFDLGPAFNIDINGKLSGAVTGQVIFGGALSMPNFHVSASIHDLGATNENTGLTPQFTPHPPQPGLTTSVTISASLIPQLVVEVKVFGGLVNEKAGIKVTGTLEGTATVGTGAACSSATQPRLESSLQGGVDLFVGSKNLNLVTFPTTSLFNECA